MKASIRFLFVLLICAGSVLGQSRRVPREAAPTSIPIPPCNTCATGGGTPGTVPVLATGSTPAAGVLKNSNITQDDAGNVTLGPIVDGTAAGSVAGKLAFFSGQDGGVVGWDKKLDVDLFQIGVYGLIENTSGAAVAGRANSLTGDPIGVWGRALSPDGSGVIGTAGPNGPAVDGSAIGVAGHSKVRGGIGVLGNNSTTSGSNVGVWGQVKSSEGTAGIFVNFGGGNIIVGKGVDAVDKFSVDASGSVHSSGSVFAAGTINAFSPFADVAERIETRELLKPGDVVEIDTDSVGRFRKVRSAYSTAVAGIVSTAPAITLSNSGSVDRPGSDLRPVLALVGRVPVRANDEGGEIRVGDLLTSSSTTGVAMRCSDRLACTGAIVGKALQPLTSSTGVIEVLVTLQ